MPELTESIPYYLAVPLAYIPPEESLPTAVHLYLNQKMVLYRKRGDHFAAAVQDRMLFGRLQYVFILEDEAIRFKEWLKNWAKKEASFAGLKKTDKEGRPLEKAIVHQRRALMDIIGQMRMDHLDVRNAVTASKQLVSELMHRPYAIENLKMLQQISGGIINHSVNVSVLAVYCGIRMGYTQTKILESIALAGLFHDIGKFSAEFVGLETLEGLDPKKRDEYVNHPIRGAEILKNSDGIPEIVPSMVAQHHEQMDGKGFPKKISGASISDLSRLLVIVNAFDECVSQANGKTLAARAKFALDQLKYEEYRYDRRKLQQFIEVMMKSVSETKGKS